MMKKFNKYIALVVAILLFSIALVGCANSKDVSSTDNNQSNADTSSEAKSTLEKIKESGKIILGTSADYPPYEFHRQIDGKDTIVGFDINVAKEIAKDLGVELEIKDMDFDGLLMALNTGNLDFVIAGMTPTKERMESVDFSKVYYDADQGLVVRTEDVEKYKSADDLKGFKVGAQKGAIQEDIAAQKLPDSQIKALAKITDLVLELKNNKIEGLVLAVPVAEAYTNANPDLALSPYFDFGKEDGVAVAVKKGNKDLVEAINNTIDRLMQDDTLDKFIQDATVLSEE